MIFVFDTNITGHHHRGAGIRAIKNYGAVMGIGEGRQGMAYAIPVSTNNGDPLPLDQIAEAVERFIQYALDNPALSFQLAPIGGSYGTYMADEIAPMFKNAPANVDIPYAFLAVNAGVDLTDPAQRRRRILSSIVSDIEKMTDNIPFAARGMSERDEVFCMTMLACFTAMRESLGDDFTHGWLRAAMKALEHDRAEAAKQDERT